MLSFMKDENNNDQPEVTEDIQATQPQPSEPEKTESAPAGIMALQDDDQPAQDDQDDYIMPSDSSKSVKKNTVILVALFLAGAACLWFMIKKTSPAPASAAEKDEQTQIEIAIAQLSGVKAQMTGQMDGIVGKFYQFSDIEQIKESQLKKNPFSHNAVFDMGQQFQNPADVQISTDSLKLWSIMSSDSANCCLINDKLLYEGDTITGLTVSKIAQNYVELTRNGRKVILKTAE